MILTARWSNAILRTEATVKMHAWNSDTGKTLCGLTPMGTCWHKSATNLASKENIDCPRCAKKLAKLEAPHA